jgi:hypothetical protein
MTIYRITHVNGWHEIVETDPAGSVSVIGCFRSDGDALPWLSAGIVTVTGSGRPVGDQRDWRHEAPA